MQHDDHKCIPVWPHPEYAKAFAATQLAPTKFQRLTLSVFRDNWLPNMQRDNLYACIFPTPQSPGIAVEPGMLLRDLAAAERP
jgi:hypothetical protein